MNKEIIERITKELKELDEKIRKIVKFKKTDTYKNLGIINADLLDSQLSIMLAYGNILRLRKAWLMAEGEDNGIMD